MKTQTVRLLDVFALGPFMVWAAQQVRPPWARDMLVVSGVLTMLYNGANYLTARRGEGVLP